MTARDTIEVWSANWWRENPDAVGDFLLVESRRPDVVGVNEGKKYVRWARAVAGFTAAVPGQGAMSNNNLALLRDDTCQYLAHWAFKVCSKVGRSPERWATVVAFRHDSGAVFFVIVTHWNSHVQKGLRPHDLPRVGQYVVQMRAIKKLVRLFRRLGIVIVVGDTNWDWGAGRWPWSPHRVFHSLDMVSQWDDPTALEHGSHGRKRGRRGPGRDLDCVIYDPDELELVDQGYVDGENSDHRWPRVVLRILNARKASR